MRKNAVLFLAHRWNGKLARAFNALAAGAPPGFDFFVLFDATSSEPPHVLGRAVYTFDWRSISALGFTPIADSLIPGSSHFPVFEFARTHPAYHQYWKVECDVSWTGRWSDFFAAHDPSADLLTTQIFSREEQSSWAWWHSLAHPSEPLPRVLLKSFNPIYRISRRGLEHLDRKLRDGWMGHDEVIMATLLNDAGYGVEDMGGHGDFVAKGNVDRFYTRCDHSRGGSGSLRAKPAWKALDSRWRIRRPKRDKLYHPVKHV